MEHQTLSPEAQHSKPKKHGAPNPEALSEKAVMRYLQPHDVPGQISDLLGPLGWSPTPYIVLGSLTVYPNP